MLLLLFGFEMGRPVAVKSFRFTFVVTAPNFNIIAKELKKT